jgi:hypothetical protein
MVLCHTKEIQAMLRRCWGLAILGMLAIAIAPAWGQNASTSYNKEAIKALSKRIDEHLAKTWKKAGVTPAPKAEDHVFFRRLNLDLAGRIPDLIPMTDFVDDDSADKRWMWVDKLLESPEHSRHFGNVWRHITMGYQTNQQFQFLVPQYENWMRERVEKNIPLDKMVLQLLTSQNGNPNMGFGRGNGQNQSSPQLFFLANENKAENLAGATSRVFLGVKIECAQCHAHPFAKWSKDQFWEFAAFYSAPPQMIRRPGIQPPPPTPSFQAGREILIPGTDKVVKAKFLNGKEPKWDILNNSRKTLADWVTAPDNPYFAKAMADHLWSYLMGVSLLEPIMEPSDDSPVTHPDLLNDLAKALIDSNFDAKFLIRAIVHTDAYQRSSGGTKLADKEDYQLFVRMPIRALSPEQIFDNVVAATTTPNEPLRQQLLGQPNQQQFFNPNQPQSVRAQFMLKYTNQDRRHEPQTSILQALFLMNGKYLTERTKLENNQDLKDLAAQIKGGNPARIRSLYMIVLSRPPRQDELNRLTPYLENGAATGNLGEALSDVYWALLNSSEFLLNH